MSNTFGPTLTLEEFEVVAELCNLDPNLPSTSELWNDAPKKPADALPGTYRNRFHAWCEAVGISPCLDALRAYALIHRGPNVSSCYGAIELNSRSKEFGSSRSGSV